MIKFFFLSIQTDGQVAAIEQPSRHLVKALSMEAGVDEPGNIIWRVLWNMNGQIQIRVSK